MCVAPVVRHESSPTYKSVISHIQVSHVTHIPSLGICVVYLDPCVARVAPHQSCPTYGRVMSHMSHIRMSHVTYIPSLLVYVSYILTYLLHKSYHTSRTIWVVMMSHIRISHVTHVPHANQSCDTYTNRLTRVCVRVAWLIRVWDMEGYGGQVSFTPSTAQWVARAL